MVDNLHNKKICGLQEGKDIPEIVVLWCLRWDLRKFGTTIEWGFFNIRKMGYG